MSNPENIPIDAEVEIEWMKAYKQRSHLSWPALARECGIPHGTLSTLLTGKYQGNVQAQATRLFQFRQKVESQEARARSALRLPNYIETPTARRIQILLETAHMGRITVAATGPGTGKTMTAREYRDSMSNVWLATMRQSTRSLTAMIAEVMRAMGLTNKSGWTQQRSGQVVEFVRDRQGLLIVDEANHLEYSAMEELRAWHDETGVGIALLGNEELLMRIKGQGSGNRHAYARLSSRIAHTHIQDMPTEGDVGAFLDAFDLDDPAIRKPLTKIALSPGHGGLREVKQILESANMLAIGDDAALEASHVEAAMTTRSTTWLRRAS